MKRSIILVCSITIAIVSITLYSREDKPEDRIIAYSIPPGSVHNKYSKPSDFLKNPYSLLEKITTNSPILYSDIIEQLNKLKDVDTVSFNVIDISLLCCIKSINGYDTLCLGTGRHIKYKNKFYLMNSEFLEAMSWIIPYQHYIHYNQKHH